MSIYVYTGTVGTGKSLHAAENIRFDLCRSNPRPVIANFAVNLDAVRHPEMYTYLPNSELSAEWLKEYARNYWAKHPNEFREDWLHLYLDEVQLCFNARTWNQRPKERMALLEFLSQSRKWGYKVVLLAQSAKMIDNQFRMLCEFEVNHRRVDSMGIIGMFLGLIFRHRLFMRVSYLFQQHERIGSEWLRKNAHVTKDSDL